MRFNITMKLAALPETVHGVLQQTEKDTYTIFINSDQTDDERAAAFLHECLHIYHNDFASQESADSIEKARHAELKRICEILDTEDKKHYQAIAISDILY